MPPASSTFLRPPPPAPALLAGATALPPTLSRNLPMRPSRLVARRPPRTASATSGGGGSGEKVFFDGGAHYGDLLVNLLLGLTLLWLPLTLAAVSRAFILRYRFTSRRVTVVSGLSGGDRTDFPYSSVSSVVDVPRLFGEWGDIVITLKDGTKVDLRSVPKFREVADYCRDMTAAAAGN